VPVCAVLRGSLLCSSCGLSDVKINENYYYYSSDIRNAYLFPTVAKIRLLENFFKLLKIQNPRNTFATVAVRGEPC